MDGSIKREDLPEVMNPLHVQNFLGISKPHAYKLVNSGQFRIKRVGQLIKIPRESFLGWYDSDVTDEEKA